MTKQRRARGTGGLFQRANGLWVASVTLPTMHGPQRRIYRSSRDHATAVRKLRELQVMVDAGDLAGDSAMKVGVWLNYWLEHVRGPNVRPKTKAFYNNAIQHHIKPVIGGKKLDKLTAGHVRAMLESIESTRTRQVAHVVLRLALKSAVTERLIRFNVTDAIPKPRHTAKSLGAFDGKTAAHIIGVAFKRCELETGPHGFSPDPPRLCRALDKESFGPVQSPAINPSLQDQAYALSQATRWAAAFLTGARQGELLGLRWSSVDLNTCCIELAWQLQLLDQEHGCGQGGGNVVRDSAEPSLGAVSLGSLARPHPCGEKITPASAGDRTTGKIGIEYTCGRTKPGFCPQRRWVVPDGFDFIPLHGSLALTRPKSRAGVRVVPLVAPLAAALMDLRAIAQPNNYDLVWTNVDGQPIHPRADHRAWQKLLVDAGIPPAPLHAARHSAGTLCQAAGVDEDTRMRIMGHSSAAAHRGYVHVSQDRARAAMEMAFAGLMPAVEMRK